MADSYAYRVRTRDGKVVAGTMEADGEAAVASRLRTQGLVPSRSRRKRSSPSRPSFTSFRRGSSSGTWPSSRASSQR